MWGNIWQYLANFETLFSFLAMIFAGYASFRLWRQKKQIIEIAKKTTPKFDDEKEAIEYHGKIHSIKPLALAISLTKDVKSIKPQVENFLKMKKWEDKMAIDDELIFDGLSPDTIVEFMNQLREKKRAVMAQGITEIHLFINGPMVAAMIVGAVFDNLPIPVKLYHANRNKPELYEYWTHLVK